MLFRLHIQGGGHTPMNFFSRMVVTNESASIGVALKAQIIEATTNNYLLCFHCVKHDIWFNYKVINIPKQAVCGFVQQ